MSLYDALAEGGALQYIVVVAPMRAMAVWDPSTQIVRVLNANGVELDRMSYAADVEPIPTGNADFWAAVHRRITAGEL